MIELVEGFPDNVVGIVTRGKVTNEECDNVLRPAMERSLRRNRKIRLYYEVGSRFPGAGWGDLDVAIDHLPQWERIAIVSDTGWVRQTVNAIRFLIASEIRVFTMLEAELARAWIVMAPAASTAAAAPDTAPLAVAAARAHALLRTLPPTPKRSRRVPRVTRLDRRSEGVARSQLK